MKLRIDKLFLYRHRFRIGFVLLGLAFVAVLAYLPSMAPGGISETEMQSAVAANNLNMETLTQGDLVNLPFRALQKLSIHVFGLSIYGIKLPAIIIGFATGLLLVLLLNRWFRSNVALLASITTVLSPIFLFLAGAGTPAITYIFFLALILWLGAKIVGAKRTPPLVFLAFILAIALSIYTPHLIYIALGIAIAGLFKPHIRFTIKNLRIPQLIIGISAIVLITLPLIIACVVRPTTLQELFFTDNPHGYLDNIMSAFAPFFSFGSSIEGIHLSPLFGLATVTLAIVGIISSTKSFFTSKNTAVSLLVLFSIFISGINPDAANIIFIPIAMLVAAGIESVLEKWYSIFPENPYARIAGIIPITIFIGIIIVSGLSYTIFGYHYSPSVARSFNNDVSIINDRLPSGSVLLVPEGTLEYDFYKILENPGTITVASSQPDRSDTCIATLGRWPEDLKLELSTIITSSKSQNSDRLYLYNCNN